MTLLGKDLKKLVQKIPDDMAIYVSKDPEGNSYAPLWSMEVCLFDKTDMEPVDTDCMDLHPEHYKEHKIEKALVIYP